MTEARKIALEMVLGSATNHPVDRERALIAFQAARTPAECDFVRATFLRNRMARLDYDCRTQRRWQSRVPRRMVKAQYVDMKHANEARATRERYVRMVTR